MAIVEDEEIGFQEVACKDLNIPFPPDTKSARKRICDHVGKRVKKMEDAIKYEYAVRNILCRLSNFNLLSSHATTTLLHCSSILVLRCRKRYLLNKQKLKQREQALLMQKKKCLRMIPSVCVLISFYSY